MNILLLIVQTLSTALFIPAGGTKVFMFDKISGQVASNKALSHEAYTGIGIFLKRFARWAWSSRRRPGGGRN